MISRATTKLNSIMRNVVRVLESVMVNAGDDGGYFVRFRGLSLMGDGL